MTDQPDEPQEKKIIIDEDWKSRVQEEKESLTQEVGEEEAPPSEDQPQPQGPLPPPTLDFVVGSFAMQAMVSMGLMANPLTGETEVQLDQAKHFVDTVEMLRDKTEGNRTAEETAMIDNLLHELRMSYLAASPKTG